MTRMVRPSITALVLSLAVTAPFAAQDRARDILAQARTAMFGKTGHAPVTSLAITANVTRVIQAVGTETTSEVRLEFLLPDKYRRTENVSIGGTTRTVVMGLNGGTFFYDDGGAAAASGLNPAKPGPMRDDAIKGLKQEFFSWLTLVAKWIRRTWDRSCGTR